MSCNRLYSRHSKLDSVVNVLVDRAVEFFLAAMDDGERLHVPVMLVNVWGESMEEEEEEERKKKKEKPRP